MDAAFQAVPEYHTCVDADHFVLSAERPAKRFACKSAHLMELRDGGLIILRISEISLNVVLGGCSARERLWSPNGNPFFQCLFAFYCVSKFQISIVGK